MIAALKNHPSYVNNSKKLRNKRIINNLKIVNVLNP